MLGIYCEHGRRCFFIGLVSPSSRMGWCVGDHTRGIAALCNLELFPIGMHRQKSLATCFIKQLCSNKIVDWSDVALGKGKDALDVQRYQEFSLQLINSGAKLPPWRPQCWWVRLQTLILKVYDLLNRVHYQAVEFVLMLYDHAHSCLSYVLRRKVKPETKVYCGYDTAA